jgi:selenide,water dikinase
MARLGAARGAAVELGLDALEDAAMLRPREGRLLLQTVDFFRSFIGDPWLFGRIAANHALGDVYAMGGRPVAALAIATLPPAAEELLADDLFQMLRGGLDTLEAAGATLVGGHSAEGSELALGFSVTGDAVPGRLLRKGGLRACDRLLLTKPLGTGCLLAAEMQGRAKGRWIAAALEAMLLSNAAAAAILAAHGARAATDVTGFGLAGHLLEMLRASGVGAHVAPAAVPALDGALETLAAGIASTLAPANEAAALAALSGASAPGHARRRLLFDPQTAGGLLAGVAEESAAACLAALRANGYREAAIIGVVTAGEPAIRLTEASAVGAPELI